MHVSNLNESRKRNTELLKQLKDISISPKEGLKNSRFRGKNFLRGGEIIEVFYKLLPSRVNCRGVKTQQQYGVTVLISELIRCVTRNIYVNCCVRVALLVASHT